MSGAFPDRQADADLGQIGARLELACFGERGKPGR
jgi:hypothetical protein